MFCKRNGYFTRHCNNCSHINFDKCGMETKCDNVYSNYNMDNDSCACGFDEEFNAFPENPMYGQSYVPIQVMGRTFKPEVGLKHGTIFPELVSPYCPNQSIEEIEFIRMNNKIGEGCNG